MEEPIYVEAETAGTGEIIRGRLVILEGNGEDIAPLPCVCQYNIEAGNTCFVIRKVIRTIRKEEVGEL